MGLGYSTFELQQYDTIGFTRKKSLKLEKYFLIFLPSPDVVHINQLTNLAQIRYLGLSYKYIKPFFFRFRTTLKIKGSSHKKKN